MVGYGRLLHVVFLSLAMLVAGLARPSVADGLYLDWHAPLSRCDGNCGIVIYGGRQMSVPLSQALGIADFTEAEFGFFVPTPIWEWTWENSALVGGAVSRRLVTFGFDDTELIDVEGELGIAQRFGTQDQTEFWAALFLRWKWFPWNDIVKTTVAASTGLNYATGVSPFEIKASGNGEGSRILHFLTPEMTFALPERPERELVFRLHHRSGGGGEGWGGFEFFNNTDGGSTYATAGIRIRF